MGLMPVERLLNIIAMQCVQMVNADRCINIALHNLCLLEEAELNYHLMQREKLVS